MFVLLTLSGRSDYIVIMDNELFYREFGRNLKDFRGKAHLTQSELAERVGLSRTSVTNIEVGRQKIPLHLLYTLAASLGVEPALLLPRKENLSVRYPELGSLTELIGESFELNDASHEWLTRVLKPHLADKVGGDDNEIKKSREGGTEDHQ